MHPAKPHLSKTGSARKLGGVAGATTTVADSALDVASAVALEAAAATVAVTAAAALGVAAGPVRPTDGVAIATVPRKVALLVALTVVKYGRCVDAATFISDNCVVRYSICCPCTAIRKFGPAICWF